MFRMRQMVREEKKIVQLVLDWEKKPKECVNLKVIKLICGWNIP